MDQTINVIAIVTGPLFAVIVSLWYQKYREDRQEKLSLFNEFWENHNEPAVPKFSQCIRRIPIVYRRYPEVITLWGNFMELVNSGEDLGLNPHLQKYEDVKFDLLSQMAKAISINITDRQIRDGSYLSQAYMDRTILEDKALEAQVLTAAALSEIAAKNKQYENERLLKSDKSDAQKN